MSPLPPGHHVIMSPGDTPTRDLHLNSCMLLKNSPSHPLTATLIVQSILLFLPVIQFPMGSQSLHFPASLGLSKSSFPSILQALKASGNLAVSLSILPSNSLKWPQSACDAGDLGLIAGLGRSPGEGNGNPLQYSCLENPMGRGAWQATVHGVTRARHDLETKPPSPLPQREWVLVSFLLQNSQTYRCPHSSFSPIKIAS